MSKGSAKIGYAAMLEQFGPTEVVGEEDHDIRPGGEGNGRRKEAEEGHEEREQAGTGHHGYWGRPDTAVKTARRRDVRRRLTPPRPMTRFATAAAFTMLLPCPAPVLPCPAASRCSHC